MANKPKRKRLYGAAKIAHQKRLKRERDKRYREKNREKIRERDRQYRLRVPYSVRKARRELRRMSREGVLKGIQWREPEDYLPPEDAQHVFDLRWIGYGR